MRIPASGITFTGQLFSRRKTYGSWSIPVSERRRYDINDGDEIIVTFQIGKEHFEEFRTVTSGGEFLLHKPLAQKLRENASAQTEIAFTVFDANDSDELKALNRRLAEKVALSLDDDVQKRRSRLAEAPGKPERVPVQTWGFIRNPDVIAEVLFLAEGACQRCEKPAPFVRRRNGEPYLEVHHVIPLADGGDDTVANAVALCPNCHREAHYG